MCVKLTNAGGFEQHRPAVQSGGQKSPSGAFLDARLAQSTRAHQEIQYPNRVLDFLFCRNLLRARRVDSQLKLYSLTAILFILYLLTLYCKNDTLYSEGV